MTTMCGSEIREYYVQVKGRAVRYGTQGQLTMASAWPKGGGGRDAVEEAGGSIECNIHFGHGQDRRHAPHGTGSAGRPLGPQGEGVSGVYSRCEEAREVSNINVSVDKLASSSHTTLVLLTPVLFTRRTAPGARIAIRSI
jgi:hypothetical protein